MIRTTPQFARVIPAPFLYEQSESESQTGRFLASMDGLMPWPSIQQKIKPLCCGDLKIFRPDTLSALVRIFYLQYWFGIATNEIEDAIGESSSIRTFVGDLSSMSPGAVARDLESLKRMFAVNGVDSKLLGLSDEIVTSNRLTLRKGSRQLPALKPAKTTDDKLYPLVQYFASIRPPFSLMNIFRFNAIYQGVYDKLSSDEKRRAEEYVDKLIEGVEHPHFASKIFGVV